VGRRPQPLWIVLGGGWFQFTLTNASAWKLSVEVSTNLGDLELRLKKQIPVPQ
jgi:hypothetical protein